MRRTTNKQGKQAPAPPKRTRCVTVYRQEIPHCVLLIFLYNTFFFVFFFCSLLSTSRDSTYREDDSRNLIDEHNTNGSSIFFNLQQQLQKQLQKQTPIQPQLYNVVSTTTTTPNNNTNNKRCKTNSYTLCTTPPPPQYSIKKSSSCSSFLIDILFRGISHLSKIIKTFPLYRFYHFC